MAYVPPHLRVGSKLTLPSAVMPPCETPAAGPRPYRVWKMLQLMMVLIAAMIPVQAFAVWQRGDTFHMPQSIALHTALPLDGMW